MKENKILTFQKIVLQNIQRTDCFKRFSTKIKGLAHLCELLRQVEEQEQRSGRQPRSVQ